MQPVAAVLSYNVLRVTFFTSCWTVVYIDRGTVSSATNMYIALAQKKNSDQKCLTKSASIVKIV